MVSSRLSHPFSHSNRNNVSISSFPLSTAPGNITHEGIHTVEKIMDDFLLFSLHCVCRPLHVSSTLRIEYPATARPSLSHHKWLGKSSDLFLPFTCVSVWTGSKTFSFLLSPLRLEWRWKSVESNALFSKTHWHCLDEETKSMSTSVVFFNCKNSIGRYE